jgi:ComF family protein
MPPDAVAFAKQTLVCGLRNAQDLLFPGLCIACRRPCARENPWLCGACISRLEQNHEARDPCPLCAQDRRFSVCACEYAWDFPFERIVSLFDFDDIVKEIAHAFKYGGLSRLAFDMGRTFCGLAPPDLFDGIDLVVPVPLHVFRRLSRGYNQAERFAAGVCAYRGNRAALRANALQRRRATRTQTALSRERRQRNLAGAFVVPRPDIVKSKSVILVDDIVTTGATTSQCAQALLDAGAKKVRVLSLARD